MRMIENGTIRKDSSAQGFQMFFSIMFIHLFSGYVKAQTV